MKLIRILLIEDDSDDVLLLQESLSDAARTSPISLKVESVDSLQLGMGRLKRGDIDVVLLDLTLPDSKGLETFTQLRTYFPSIPIVILTGFDNDTYALEAMRKGAQDYLVKGEVNGKMLVRILNYAIERKSTSEVMERLMRQNELILNAAGEGILGLDQAGKMTFVNPTAARLIGWDIEKLIGQSKHAFLHHSRFEGTPYPEEECPIHICLQDGVVRFVEDEVFWRRDKKSFPVEYIATPIKEKDQIVGAVVTFRDISERKRLEHMKDEFVSAVSHEMRTPLTIIKGAVSNLKDGVVGSLSEKQQGVIEMTSRNIDRLARIINDLLDLSRLESGKAKMNKGKMNSASLIQEVIQNFSNQAREKKIDLKDACLPGLPSVYADPDMIIQVLTNLLGNALRFAKSQIRVVTHLNEIGEGRGRIRVSVEDDGPGIQKEDRAKLFNKFEQIHRPVEGPGYKGTGLGLAICKEIIDRHEGRIGVESVYGKGSQFYFELPLYDEQSDFFSVLSVALGEARLSQTPLSLLRLSIENMREVKKQALPDEVDRFFQEVGQKIRLMTLRKADNLYRYTQETFGIILPETGRSGALAIMRRIQEVFSATFFSFSKGKVLVQLRVGCAVYPEEADSAQKLMEKANETTDSHRG